MEKNMFGLGKSMDVESEMAGNRVSAPETVAPVTTTVPEATATEAAPVTTSEATSEVETLRAQLAQARAELAAARAERPSRADILKKQAEARRAAVEKVKKAASAVGNEILLVADPDGREYVKEDIKAVGDEALRRANEVKNRAVAKAGEAWKWAAGRAGEVAETAEAGVADLIEYTSANIREPLIKMEVGQDRFFGSLLALARMKVEDIKIGIQGRAEWVGRVGGVVAGAVEGVNVALEDQRFEAVETMREAGEKMAKGAAARAKEARRRAAEYRGTKMVIMMDERFNDLARQNEEKAAEERAKMANKFPNFVSKWKRLFGGS